MHPSDDVKTMREYLTHVLRFEGYVHYWKEAMTRVNQKMRELMQRKNQVNAAYQQASIGLQTADQQFRQKQADGNSTARGFRKARRIFLILGLVLVAIALIAVILLPLKIEEKIVVIPVLGPFAAVFFILSSVMNRKSRDYRNNSNDRSIATQKQQYRAEENANFHRCKEELMYLERAETDLIGLQKEVRVNLSTAEDKLGEMYALDYLPRMDKYRNMPAVAAFLSYIESWRCTVIKGAGGIYTTYEEDLRHEKVIDNLTMISSKLDTVIQYQAKLVETTGHIDQRLDQMNHTLNSIDRGVQCTAYNTGVSAAANQQTAAAASFIADRMHWGY